MWSRMRNRIAGLFGRRRGDVQELIRTDNHETAAADSPQTGDRDAITDNTVADEAVAEETVAEETVREETVAEETVAESTVPEVAENTVTETQETAEPTPGFDIVWLNPSKAAESPPTDTPAEAPAEQPAAVAPPEDFKFPWTRPDSETASEPDAVPPEPQLEPDLVESTLDASPARHPETKRPGFFSRLFGKKPKEVATAAQGLEPVLELQPDDIVAIVSQDVVGEASVVDEPSAVDEPIVEEPIVDARPDEPIFVENPIAVAEETFTSVEDALPASEEISVTDERAIEADEDVPPPPARGFFARLFRRRATEEQPRRLSVEVYQDRIEAAANALDVAGENAFTPGEDTLPEADDVFDSVEEALPTDGDPLAETLEPVDVVVPVAGRFMPVDEPLPSIEDLAPEVTAPRPPAPPAPPVEEQVDAPIAPIDVPIDVPIAAPIDEPIAKSIELPIELPIEKPIGELIEEPVAAAEDEVAPIEAPTSSRDTLEIERKTDEFEQKTDEFEIIPPPEEVPAEEAVRTPSDETISLERKSVWSRSFVGRLFKRGETEVEKVGAGAAAQAAEGSAVFLLAKFRAFYNEIIRFKHQKSEFTAGFATAIVTEYSADLSPDSAAEGLSKRLTELLELQAAEAKWMGGEAADRYPDAQYAMAALADETFTHLEWEGQGSFPKYSIEKKLYQTNAADVDVFRRMDKLLKDSPDSIVARDLARVYLLVIAAGFRGKYRPFGLTRALAEYRHRLYEYIHNGDALMLYAPERRIFPEAVSQTLAGQALRRFSAAQRWAAILLFLVITYTLIAHVAWNRVAADLKDVTARIKSGSTAGAR